MDGRRPRVDRFRACLNDTRAWSTARRLYDKSIQDVAGFKSTAVAIRHLEVDNCLDWITQNFKTNVLSLYAWATAYSDFLI